MPKRLAWVPRAKCCKGGKHGNPGSGNHPNKQLLAGYFHPFTAGSHSGLFTGFRRFVTSDFGGFAKSLDVFWLDDTLFGGKFSFERNFIYFHC